MQLTKKYLALSWNYLCWVGLCYKPKLMASCKTYFLCTLYKLMLIHIRLYSLLLFNKILKFKKTLAVTCIHLGYKCTKRRWHQSSQKYTCKGKDSSQARWMRAAVMWGKFPYFSCLPQPVFTPPPPTHTHTLPTPSTRVELILFPRLHWSVHWQLSWLPLRQACLNLMIL